MEDISNNFYKHQRQSLDKPLVDFDKEEDLTAMKRQMMGRIAEMMLSEETKPSFTDEDLLIKQYKIAKLAEARLFFMIYASPNSVCKNEVAMYKICFDSYSKIYELVKGKKINITTKRVLDLENDPELKEIEQAIRTFKEQAKKV